MSNVAPDRSALIQALQSLDSTSLTAIIALVPGALERDPPQSPPATRVAALISFAESTIGPGLPVVAATVLSLFPQLRTTIFPTDSKQQAQQIVSLPRQNPYFTGRAAELKQLYAVLHGEEQVAIIQAIAGLGGIGKTALAIAYAYQHKDEYAYVLFCRADSTTSLNSGYQTIAQQLALPVADTNDYSQNVAAVLSWLNQAPSYLLILDNVDFGETFTEEMFMPYLPNDAKGHILITTRTQEAQEAFGIHQDQVLSLDTLTKEDAVRFLIGRVYGKKTPTKGEAESARQLAKDLGYLALALEQAGAYISKMQCTLAGYRIRFAEMAVALLGEVPKFGEYKETVLTTWKLCFEEVAKRGLAPIELLYLSAFLSPDAIPKEIVLAAIGNERLPQLTAFFAGAGSEVQRGDRYDRLLKELTDYSLVSKDRDNDTFFVHRLVQMVIREQLSPTEREEWTDRTVTVISVALPSMEFTNWSLYERLVSCGQGAIEWTKQYQYRSRRVARLSNQLALYFHERGEYELALPLYKESLTILYVLLPVDHPDIAISLNNLGGLYSSQGLYDLALTLYVKSLAIRRVSLPTGHPDIANSLNNLAELYRLQGLYEKALPLYEEALATLRNSLPANHPDMANCLHNLALLYKAQGLYEKALPLYEKALMIRRVVLPAGHPQIADNLNDLAGLYYSQGLYDRALPFLEESMAIRRASLSDSHPDIANSLNNLAELYRLQGLYEKALPLYEEALAIRRAVLPAGHPHIAASLNNLALFFQLQGSHEKALTIFEESLIIYRASLPANHPDMARTINNLAGLYFGCGELDKAEPLFLEALSMRRAALPASHPDIANTLSWLASLRESQERYGESLVFGEEALELLLAGLGAEHLDTRNVLALMKRLRAREM